MKKRIFAIVGIVIIYIFCMIWVIIKDTNQQQPINNDLSEQKIDNIKEDLGYNNLDNGMYEIKEEYDGREVLAIKPSIKYKVAMAGAIKKSKPEFSEIDKIMEQAPNKNGIWITEGSREKFLNYLNKLTDANHYNIDDYGYLIKKDDTINNDIDRKIRDILTGKKLYAVDINNMTYTVDEVTGTIEEYPFEEIDPKSPYELFETENASLYIINSNIDKMIEDKYIFEDFFNNID